MSGAIGGTPHSCLCTDDICANDGAACTAGGGIWTSQCASMCACPEATATCDGDLDGSGGVDVNDLLALLSDFGGTDASSDLDDSGTVDVNDLLALLSAFGSTCSVAAAAPAPPPPPACTQGSDCGGQIWNTCASSCPSICGTPDAMICNMMCNQAFECPFGQCFNEATGACE
jgi:hypothetical protein